jgi:hypothetical protein
MSECQPSYRDTVTIDDRESKKTFFSSFFALKIKMINTDHRVPILKMPELQATESAIGG